MHHVKVLGLCELRCMQQPLVPRAIRGTVQGLSCRCDHSAQLRTDGMYGIEASNAQVLDEQKAVEPVSCLLRIAEPV